MEVKLYESTNYTTPEQENIAKLNLLDCHDGMELF